MHSLNRWFTDVVPSDVCGTPIYHERGDDYRIVVIGEGGLQWQYIGPVDQTTKQECEKKAAYIQYYCNRDGRWHPSQKPDLWKPIDPLYGSRAYLEKYKTLDWKKRPELERFLR